MNQFKPTVDKVTTINEDGSRFFLHPADTRGPFTFWRRVLAVLLIAVFVALPWIQINEHPAVLMDFINRRFHFFGYTLAPQDLWMLFFLLTGTGFTLFFLTALFGRLWCGWACPQTVYLEHVYRRIERWIEGDATRRRQLDAAPWDGSKFIKRASKHLVFILISVAIAHIFLAYIIPVQELYSWILAGPTEHFRAFSFIVIASSLLYLNFAWFREQLCLIICPYGRFQSVLVDEDTLTIGYDEKRGEPRGKPSNPEHGDCIDCFRCVQVCPTGIDIRHGLQMECVACHNCADACDAIMSRLNRPKGLIRYDSKRGLEGKKTRFIRPRIYIYTVLLLLGATVAGLSVSNLQSADARVTRMRGAPFFSSQGMIRNQYMVRLINKRNITSYYALEIMEGAPAELVLRGFEKLVAVEPMDDALKPLVVMLPREAYSASFPFSLRIMDMGTDPDNPAVQGEMVEEMMFLGPDPRLLGQPRESLPTEGAPD